MHGLKKITKTKEQDEKENNARLIMVISHILKEKTKIKETAIDQTHITIEKHFI